MSGNAAVAGNHVADARVQTCVRPHLLAVVAMLLALCGCSSPRPAAPVAAGSASASPRPTSSTPTTRPTLKQIVHDAKSTLYAVDVHRDAEGYTVSAWWALARENKVYGAIVTSDDRFESAHYERGGWAIWAKHQPLTKNVPAPGIEAFRGLLASPVKSLDPDTRAFVAGGDGATLLPFEAVARSRDGGDWEAYVVPKTHGDRAYDEGDLVLPDGRLLVLLDAWSSDRGWTRPGPEYHGLWISAGDDWASYTPYRPTFAPALRASDAVNRIEAQPSASGQAHRGLVVATTRDNTLYVSTDGAKSFHRIRAR